MRQIFFVLCLLCFFAPPAFSENPNSLIIKECLKKHYPAQNLAQLDAPFIYKSKKEYEIALKDSNLQDSFAYPYPLDSYAKESFEDSSRIRNYDLLKNVYGENKSNVESNLKQLKWLDGTMIFFNTQNGAYEALNRVKARLEHLLVENPHFIEFLKNIGGTYKWRKIAQSNRLSAHSFGIAIDINVSLSRYWLWDLQNANSLKREEIAIPQDIIDAFEEEGFIWGGRWWHYDSMHFEYRPEILCYAKSLKH